MTRSALAGFVCAFLAEAQQPPGIVPQVHKAVNDGQFAVAGQLLDSYKSSHGVTPEYIEAFSWIGRGQLQSSHLDAAAENAAAVRKLSDGELTRRKLDAEPHLP